MTTTTRPLPATSRDSATAPSLLDRALLGSINWEQLLYVILILLAVLSRLYDLGARVMSHDESLHTFYSWNLSVGKGFQHTPLMHGPFLFHITALSYFLFGDSDFTARLPYALFGIVLVALPYFFRRELGRIGALVASFALLISPSILYHARYIRQEGTIVVWTTLTVIFVWRYLETRKLGWLMALAAVLAFHTTDKSTSFLNVAMFVAFLAFIALIQFGYSRNGAGNVATALKFVVVIALAMVLLSLLLALLAPVLVSALGLTSIVTQTAPSLLLTFDGRTIVFGLVTLAIGAAAAYGLYRLLTARFGKWIATIGEEAPAFDVLVVMVTTTLFAGSAAILLVVNPIVKLLRGTEALAIKTLGEVSQLSFNPTALTTMFALTVALGAISVAIGLAWGWRRYLGVIGIFLAICIPLFTTMFTNLAGIGTGFVGQLGYWMAQQDVQRGTQPWYYYMLLVPLYEFFALAGGIGGIVLILAGRTSRQDDTPAPAERVTETDAPRGILSFGPLEIDVSGFDRNFDFRQWLSPSRSLQLFVVWWAVSTFAIYSTAGEKMPWLTSHIALPLALLTGLFINELVVSGGKAWRASPPARVALAAGLGLAAALTLARILAVVGSVDIPAKDNGAALVRFVGDLVVGVGMLVAILFGIRRLAPGLTSRLFTFGIFSVLAVLCIRTAIMVTYINYDYTREYLFYAHGAPGVKIAINQLEDISNRLNNGNTIKVGYDSKVSWPLTWYMRSSQFPNARFQGDEFPGDFMTYGAFLYGNDTPKREEIDKKLAENFTRFEYAYVWWPVEDYKDMTFERLRYSLVNPQARQALWEIVFNRNYEPYAKLFNKTNLRPDNWSPSGRFGLYIRNDIAAQVWQLKLGSVAGGDSSGTSIKPKDPIPAPSAPSGLGPFTPGGISVLANGDRYVTDRRNDRIVLMDSAGNTKLTFGGEGSEPGNFQEPWGITVDREGFVWVADTFNHRVQKFTSDGALLFSFGGGGVSQDAGQGRNTVFFGPRDIKVGGNGRVYVTDTGNKRIQMFDSEGNFQGQVGGEGDGAGQFREPVGLALDAANNVYVVDTWNRRIQVLDANLKPVRSFPITAWEGLKPEELQAVDNKPYAAVSGTTLFVTSPRTHNVLAFSLTGAPVSLPNVAFGDADRPTGVGVGNGKLYVANATNGTVLEFPLDPKVQ
ncbi:MAG: TIGR03663 family protein [Thermoflexales bacterium]|nr:TIGR03663 family protein [Thermoflexales bacterium]